MSRLRSKNMTLNPRIYQSILQIALSSPSIKLTQFYNEMREKAKEKFNVPYHNRIFPLFLMAKAAYLYDAVVIYAKAATKTLQENGDLKDGMSLMRKYIFNNTYASKQGFNVYIDENGNAEGNFSLIGIQNYNGTYKMEKIGFFVQANENLPNLKLLSGKKILWIKGHPPNDEPVCGFEGCPLEKSFFYIGILSTIFLIVVSIFLIR